MFERSKTRLELSILVLLFAFFFQSKTWAETEDVAIYKQGLCFYLGGHYEKALVKFEQATDENFDFWQSYQMIGYCHFQLREKDAALGAFRESLRLHPQNPKLEEIYQDLQAGTTCFYVQPVTLSEDRLPIGVPVVLRLSSAKP